MRLLACAALLALAACGSAPRHARVDGLPPSVPLHPLKGVIIEWDAKPSETEFQQIRAAIERTADGRAGRAFVTRDEETHWHYEMVLWDDDEIVTIAKP